MGDFGLKVSQTGIPVATAADYQLLFSSSWPLLKIHAQGSFTISDMTKDVTIATHSLGYNPVFWVFDTSTVVEPTAGRSRIAFPGTSQYIGINGTDLKWLGLTRGSPPGAFTGYYFIFRYDLTSSFTAPIITTSPASAGATSPDFGIKVSLPGKSTNSTDLRDYAIHSSTRSPMIHKTGSGTLSASITITHSLGYEPMYFLYYKINSYGDSRYQMVASADDNLVTLTTTTMVFGFGQPGTYGYIIFKDPMLIN